MAKLKLMKGRWREGQNVSYNNYQTKSLPYMSMIMNFPVRLGQAIMHARAAVVYGHVTLR
jgi:hypothetical protein